MSTSARKFVILRSPSVGNYENSPPAQQPAGAKKSRSVTAMSDLDTLWQEFSDQWQTHESSVTPTEPASVDSVRIRE
jgi:hypothetical protein